MKDTLINNFMRISRIPRESGHEEKIADFFMNVAKEKKLYAFKDENNNVLIKKKGTINSSPVALQAHLDMVCVKTEKSNHQFENEGIEVIVDGDSVKAKDTTLGADQGVGLAIMLTIIEDDTLKHPDLEFIFTVEEETTFKGAVSFPYSKVESKRLINLDNAKDNTVVNGSDGDILNEYTFNGEIIENDLPSYKILIDNFPGGNSGDNINLSSNNAITKVAELLKDKDTFLKSINGGTFENDIASSCEIIINTKLDINNILENVHYKVENIDNKYTFSLNDTKKIINEILALKSGYISSNNASANLGLIRTNDNSIKILYIVRSINELELEKISNNTKKLANNFQVSEIYRDSIWKINEYSDLLHKYKELYYKEYKEYPKEDIGHGGTECSAIMKRIDNLDIISIGANMEHIHTTNEITYISSWIKIYNILIKFLESL